MVVNLPQCKEEKNEKGKEDTFSGKEALGRKDEKGKRMGLSRVDDAEAGARVRLKCMAHVVSLTRMYSGYEYWRETLGLLL